MALGLGKRVLGLGHRRLRPGMHAARAMDLILNTLVGYFVDEPELTPEQARAQIRADAERAEAQGFAAARRGGPRCDQ